MITGTIKNKVEKSGQIFGRAAQTMSGFMI
jgi:hypothetical protein